MTTNTHPIATASPDPVVGDDITEASDAVVMRSSPDLALPLESESANRADPYAATEPIDMRQLNEQATENPGAAIALAAGAGLLLGIVVKKMFPARRG